MGYKRPRKEKRRGKRIVLVCLAVLAILLLAGGWYMYRQFKLETAPVIKNSAGTTHPYNIPNSETKRVDEGFFAFDLPANWRLVQHATSPYNLYSFQSTIKNADNRYLDVYADSIPVTLAVNKAVAIKGQGNNISHGEVSENCTTLVPAQAAAKPKQLAIHAKWDGVEFICDNDSTTRNVVGTSSVAAINKVALTGPSGMAHTFFFVYTDNNYTPDYTILYKLLDSFTVK